MDFNISLEPNKSFSVKRDDILILQPEREHIKVKSTTETQKIYPSGEKVIGSVEVLPLNLQSKSVKPLEEPQEVVADEGFDGLSKVSVLGAGGGGYQREDWYPDVLEILKSTSSFEANGDTYRPQAVVLLNNVNDTIKLFRRDSYSSLDENFYNSLNGHAYKYSDTEEIELVDESLDYMAHTWDKSKDFVNPNNPEESVRYIIVYYRDSPNYQSYKYAMLGGNEDVIELWYANGYTYTSSYWAVSGYNSISSQKESPLKYFYMDSDCRVTGTANYSFYNLVNLVEVKILCEQGFSFSSADVFSRNYMLEKVTITNCVKPVRFYLCPSLTEYKGVRIDNYSSQFNNCVSLKVWDYSKIGSGVITLYATFFNFPGGVGVRDEVILPTEGYQGSVPPSGLSSIGGSIGANCIIKKMEIPPNFTSIPSNIQSNFYVVQDLILYDDFPADNLVLNGADNANPSTVRPVSFLKNLCKWVKDNSGSSAKTITLKTGNINALKKLFLTFDATTKEILSWVKEGTAGAISAFEFLTLQKNYTLS